MQQAGAGGLSFVKDGGSFSRLNRLLQIQVIQHQYREREPELLQLEIDNSR